MSDVVTKPEELDRLSVERSENGDGYSDELEVEAWRQKNLSRLRLVWAHRRTVARVTCVGMLLSLAIAFIIPKRFESTARLMPPEPASPMSGLAMLAATGATGSSLGSGALGSGMGSLAGDLLGLKNSGALFVGIFRSQTVEDDIIKKFNLQKVYHDQPIQDARDDLEDHTDASEDRKSGIISIRVTDRSPERAAGIAQEYVEELNRVVVSLNTSSAHRERVFLEQRLAEVKQDLAAAEKHFSEFASKNTAMDIPAQGKATIEAAAVLEGQYIAAQTELETLKPIYADGNVRVRAAKARIEELKRQLDKIGGRFDSADAAAGQGDQSINYPSLKKLPVLGVAYADLYREARIEEVVFGTLTQQYESAKVQEAKETPTVKVLDPPKVPDKKVFPPRVVITLLGTFLALALAVTWISVKTGWESVDVTDPRKQFAMEVLTTTRASLRNFSRNGEKRSTNGDQTQAWLNKTEGPSGVNKENDKPDAR
jgi:uncharacterized protein involved in exopolysaccharide biosynthesis